MATMVCKLIHKVLCGFGLTLVGDGFTIIGVLGMDGVCWSEIGNGQNVRLLSGSIMKSLANHYRHSILQLAYNITSVEG